VSVPERDHLSIGEVLALLQAEFPDVTISKIRFLESQGLIDPERTPSGYRKFYEHDIARLRWILCQQRDHFLPLKVIKDRLEEADEAGTPLSEIAGPAVAEAEPELAEPEPAELAAVTVPEVADAPVERDAISSGAPVATRPRLNVFTGTTRAARRDASRGGDGRSQSAPAEAVGDPAPTDTPSADGHDATDVDAGRPEIEVAVAPSPAVPTPGRPAATGRSEASATPARRRRGRSGGGPFGDLSSVSFTVDELAAAVGSSVAQIEELERYGLITSRSLSQGRRYGDDAVVVAKLAQRFAAHGIEARHLRMFRVAVDRELALYEQVVAPLARQRTDSGEGRAARLWAELDQLGADLRDALFQRGPS